MTEETASVETGNAAPAAVQTEAVTPETPAATTSNDWKSSLPDDIRESPSLAKFETIEGLAKSYVNAERMIGSDKVVIPKDGDADGFRQVMSKLGLPETAEGYDFKAPESIPEGLQYSAEVDGRLAGIFHKHGLPKSMAGAVRDDLIKLVSEGGMVSLEQAAAAQEAAQKQIEQGEAALKQEWGAAYEQRGKIAAKAFEANFPAEAVPAFEESGLLNNPHVIKGLYELGVKMQGEKSLLGEIELEQSPADLDARIAKFQSDNMTALMDQSHPDHSRVIAERNKLYEKRWA